MAVIDRHQAQADDKALVMRACRGDRQAFAQIHTRFAPAVHALLLARVPHGDAEDLVQDVFVRALEKLDTLRDPAAIGPWLSALARNMATDFYRARKQAGTLPEGLEAPKGRATDAREVLAVIRALPEAHSEPLVMRLVEGMTGPEIADVLGMTPGSVRVNLHRGMKMLRERLGLKRNGTEAGS